MMKPVHMRLWVPVISDLFHTIKVECITICVIRQKRRSILPRVFHFFLQNWQSFNVTLMIVMQYFANLTIGRRLSRVEISHSVS